MDSEPTNFSSEKPFAQQTPIPVMESENWPSLSEALSAKPGKPEKKEKQYQPAQGQISKGQGSALQPPLALAGSGDACAPHVSRSCVTHKPKGLQPSMPPALAPKCSFQHHRSHPPMQARLPGPWVEASVERGFWPPSQGYQMCHPHWPTLHPRGNVNIQYLEYFGNVPNSNGSHLQGPGGPSSMFGIPRAYFDPARSFANYIPHPPNRKTWMQAYDPLSKKKSLRIGIVKQIEYYFSDENLPRDYYLRLLMGKDGWVEISKIAEFNRVKNMTTNIPCILDALRSSALVEVQGNKIRRRNDWSKWVPVSMLSLEESQTPDGFVEDKSDTKNHHSCEGNTQKAL